LLTAAHILHVDETGAKVTGARWWLHVAATDTLTTYHLDRSRGRPAITELGVLTGFEGIAMHDCRASYHAYTDCEHALCGAHIARELVAADETHPGQHWPQQALDALFALNTAAHDARDRGGSEIPPDVADPLLRAWRHAILVGLAQHPAKTGRKQTKTRNLLEVPPLFWRLHYLVQWAWEGASDGTSKQVPGGVSGSWCAAVSGLGGPHDRRGGPRVGGGCGNLPQVGASG
jgi:hypothetical protein